MNKYLKYSVLNNSSDNQQFELPQIQNKSEINDITEHSTPKEMANYITTKLVEFIEQELKAKKEVAPSSEKVPA